MGIKPDDNIIKQRDIDTSPTYWEDKIRFIVGWKWWRSDYRMLPLPSKFTEIRDEFVELEKQLDEFTKTEEELIQEGILDEDGIREVVERYAAHFKWPEEDIKWTYKRKHETFSEYEKRINDWNTPKGRQEEIDYWRKKLQDAQEWLTNHGDGAGRAKWISDLQDQINKEITPIEKRLQDLEPQLKQAEANAHHYKQEIKAIKPPTDTEEVKKKIKELEEKIAELKSAIATAIQNINDFGDDPEFAYLKNKYQKIHDDAKNELGEGETGLEVQLTKLKGGGTISEKDSKRLPLLQKAFNFWQQQVSELTEDKNDDTYELERLKSISPEATHEAEKGRKERDVKYCPKEIEGLEDDDNYKKWIASELKKLQETKQTLQSFHNCKITNNANDEITIVFRNFEPTTEQGDFGLGNTIDLKSPDLALVWETGGTETRSIYWVKTFGYSDNDNVHCRITAKKDLFWTYYGYWINSMGYGKLERCSLFSSEIALDKTLIDPKTGIHPPKKDKFGREIYNYHNHLGTDYENKRWANRDTCYDFCSADISNVSSVDLEFPHAPNLETWRVNFEKTFSMEGNINMIELEPNDGGTPIAVPISFTVDKYYGGGDMSFDKTPIPIFLAPTDYEGDRADGKGLFYKRPCYIPKCMDRCRHKEACEKYRNLRLKLIPFADAKAGNSYAGKNFWNEYPHLVRHTTIQFYFSYNNISSIKMLYYVETLYDAEGKDNNGEPYYYIPFQFSINANPAGIFWRFQTGKTGGGFFWKEEFHVRSKLTPAGLLGKLWNVGSWLVKTFTGGKIDPSQKASATMSFKDLMGNLGIDLDKKKEKASEEQQTDRTFKSTMNAIASHKLNLSVEPKMFYANTHTVDYDLLAFANRFISPEQMFRVRAEYSNNLLQNIINNLYYTSENEVEKGDKNNTAYLHNSPKLSINNHFSTIASWIRKGFIQAQVQLIDDVDNAFGAALSKGIWFYDDLEKDFSVPEYKFFNGLHLNNASDGQGSSTQGNIQKKKEWINVGTHNHDPSKSSSGNSFGHGSKITIDGSDEAAKDMLDGWNSSKPLQHGDGKVACWGCTHGSLKHLGEAGKQFKLSGDVKLTLQLDYEDQHSSAGIQNQDLTGGYTYRVKVIGDKLIFERLSESAVLKDPGAGGYGGGGKVLFPTNNIVNNINNNNISNNFNLMNNAMNRGNTLNQIRGITQKQTTQQKLQQGHTMTSTQWKSNPLFNNKTNYQQGFNTNIMSSNLSNFQTQAQAMGQMRMGTQQQAQAQRTFNTTKSNQNWGMSRNKGQLNRGGRKQRRSR